MAVIKHFVLLIGAVGHIERRLKNRKCVSEDADTCCAALKTKLSSNLEKRHQEAVKEPVQKLAQDLKLFLRCGGRQVTDASSRVRLAIIL